MDKINKNFLGIMRLLYQKKIILFGTGYFDNKVQEILEEFSFNIDLHIKVIDNKTILKRFLSQHENCVLINLEVKEVEYLLNANELSSLITVINSSDFVSNYYGFVVGKHSYGFGQFFYKGINIEKIGAFCSIADNIQVALANHPTQYISTHPFFYLSTFGEFIKKDNKDIIGRSKSEKISIGNDVWIGTNVTLLPAISIGNGVIIGAGSVVTKDVPDYAVVAGVPAKILRFRFSDSEIEILNRIKWWEWSDSEIKKNVDFFQYNNMFLEKFKDFDKQCNSKNSLT